MKAVRTVLVLAALAAIAAPASAQRFEGVVRQRLHIVPPGALATLTGTAPAALDLDRVFAITAGEIEALPISTDPLRSIQSLDQTITTKGKRTRIDISIGGPLGAMVGEVSMVNDGDAERTFMLIPMMASYLEIDPGTFGQQQATLIGQLQPGLVVGANESFRDLDERTILGFTTSGFEVRIGDDLVTRSWTARDLEGVIFQSNFETDSLTAAIQARGYPLVTQSVLRTADGTREVFGDGYVYTLMEVMEIETGEVAAELFELPAGYQRLEASMLDLMPFTP